MRVSHIAIPPPAVSDIFDAASPLMTPAHMTNGRQNSLKEVGALARLLLGTAIALEASMLGWLGQNWDLSNQLVQAALAVAAVVAVAIGFLLETARAVARAMED